MPSDPDFSKSPDVFERVSEGRLLSLSLAVLPPDHARILYNDLAAMPHLPCPDCEGFGIVPHVRLLSVTASETLHGIAFLDCETCFGNGHVFQNVWN